MIQNKTIRSISIHRKKPWYRWLHTVPFFIVELILLVPLLYVHLDMLRQYVSQLDNEDMDQIIDEAQNTEVETTILGWNVLWWIISLFLLILIQVTLLLSSYWSVSMRVFMQFSGATHTPHIDQISQELKQRAMELPTTITSRASRRAASRKPISVLTVDGRSDPANGNAIVKGTEAVGYVVKVVPWEHKGHTEICPLGYSTHTETLYFNYQRRRYQYNVEEHRFEKPNHNRKADTVQSYAQRNGILSKDVPKLTEVNGMNRFDIPMPSFLDLFKEHALAPFFVFQVFCVGLWCLDEYWYYSLMTLVMLFIFEATVVKQRMRNMEQVKQMATKPEVVYVYRDKRWQEIMSDRLLPNDIISLVKQAEGKVSPCDVVLLSGKCVTNESLLTGESIPQMKECLPQQFDNDSEASSPLDIKKKDKRYAIFGGTRIMHHQQTTEEYKASPRWHPPNGGAVGIVLRTGFDTSQGKLIRTILYTTERVTANNLEALLFILFMLVFAILASAYVLMHGLQDPSRSRYKLLLNCILIITSCVPPELPMELSMAVNTSLMFLVRFGIFCTEPFRIPFAGKVNVCCFDKTGTLTSEKMVLTGVVECDSTQGEHKVVKGKQAEYETKAVLAGCHSLINLDGDVVGDPMEKAALNATGFTVLDTAPASAEAVVVPMKSQPKPPGIAMITILKRFAFNSELKRMSSIVKIRDEIMVVSKGAPEVMKSMLFPESVPDNYDDLLEEYAIGGSRVITLAHRVIYTKQTFRKEHLASLTRDEVEKDLIFDGFALFESDIKMGTAEAIDHLLESSHKVIMITGDNALTACHVARKLHMVSKPALVLTLLDEESDPTNPTSHLVWHAHHEHFPVLGNGSRPVDKLLEQYDLCVQGDALEALLKEDAKWLERHAADIVVYARVAPEQKESVLSLLKSQGNFTLMCGDGTNDVGALKQAHVGIALLEGEITAEKWKDLNKSVSFIEQLKEQQARQRKITEEKNRLIALVRAGDREAPKKLRNLTMSQFPGGLSTASTAEGDAPLVKLGDASIASPFSSKYSTIRSTEKILQQGRCTLVTTLQMYKILALNCLISAYSLSVLYLDGVKYGDTQMLITGLLIAACFLFISRAKPLDRLSSEKPQSTIFNPYMMFSILGQFAIHLVSLILTVLAAKSIAPRIGPIDTESEYEPNLLNTAVFLITSAQTVATFSNNYRGRPFMESLVENKPLLYCLSALLALIIVLGLGIMPDLNEYLELVVIPSEHVPLFSGLMCINLVGVFIYERLLLRMFRE